MLCSPGRIQGGEASLAGNKMRDAKENPWWGSADQSPLPHSKAGKGGKPSPPLVRALPDCTPYILIENRKSAENTVLQTLEPASTSKERSHSSGHSNTAST